MANTINEIIDVLSGAESINIRPRILYCKLKGKYVPIAEVYSKNYRHIQKKIRGFITSKNYYQAVQQNEEQLIKKLGHSVALSIYQYAKCKAQFKNRVPDFTAKEISKALGVKYRTCLRGIKDLQKENVVQKVGSGRDTAYYINPAYFQKGRIETMSETCRLFMYSKQSLKKNAEASESIHP